MFVCCFHYLLLWMSVSEVTSHKVAAEWTQKWCIAGCTEETVEAHLITLALFTRTNHCSHDCNKLRLVDSEAGSSLQPPGHNCCCNDISSCFLITAVATSLPLEDGTNVTPVHFDIRSNFHLKSCTRGYKLNPHWTTDSDVIRVAIARVDVLVMT